MLIEYVYINIYVFNIRITDKIIVTGVLKSSQPLGGL